MPISTSSTENSPSELIPAGYMAKRIAEGPLIAETLGLSEVWSVSECISKNFTNYIPYWKHNGYWLFNSPREIIEIAHAESLDPSELKLCYYRMFPWEFHESSRQWMPVASPTTEFNTEVRALTGAVHLGFDVVTYSDNHSPGCSPLTCNYLANNLRANQWGLLDTFGKAKSTLEAGAFDNSEPGPFRIIEVSTLPWPEDERHNMPNDDS